MTQPVRPSRPFAAIGTFDTPSGRGSPGDRHQPVRQHRLHNLGAHVHVRGRDPARRRARRRDVAAPGAHRQDRERSPTGGRSGHDHQRQDRWRPRDDGHHHDLDGSDLERRQRLFRRAVHQQEHRPLRRQRVPGRSWSRSRGPTRSRPSTSSTTSAAPNRPGPERDVLPPRPSG